jgi:hypothetical protein
MANNLLRQLLELEKVIMSEDYIVKKRFSDVVVHFEMDDPFIGFKVFPVQDWAGCDGSKGTSYVIKDSGCEGLDVFDEEKAEKLFEGTFCWRGVWEGRIYFPNEEYWGDDLIRMAALYENEIVPWCKNFIKKRNPEICDE